MNLVRLEERLKDLSEDQLREAFPKGIIPQFLIMSELNRRKEVKDEYQRSQAEQGTTVAEDLLTVTDGPMAVGMERMGVMAQPQNRMEMQPGNLPVDQSMAAMPPMPMMPQEATALPDPEPMRMQPGGLVALSSSSNPTVLDAILEQRRRAEAERNFRRFGLADETGRPLAMVDPVPEEQFDLASNATLASRQAALGLPLLAEEMENRQLSLEARQAQDLERQQLETDLGVPPAPAFTGSIDPLLNITANPTLASQQAALALPLQEEAQKNRQAIQAQDFEKQQLQTDLGVPPAPPFMGFAGKRFTEILDDQRKALAGQNLETTLQQNRGSNQLSPFALQQAAFAEDTQDRPGIADAMTVLAATANKTSPPVGSTVPQQTSVGQPAAGQSAADQSAQMIDTGTSIASDPNLMSSTSKPLGMSKINFELLNTDPAINDSQINTQAYLTNQVASTQAALKDSKSAFKEFEDDLKKMKEGLGDKKDRAVGLALLEAGLRIAGSQSPNLSGAIGEAAPALQTFTKSLDQIDDDRKNIINSKLKLVQAQQAELRGKKDDAREALRDARQFNKDIQDREEKIEQRKARNAELRAKFENIDLKRATNKITKEFNAAKLEILRNDIDNQIAVFTGKKLSLLNDPNATEEQKKSVEDTLKTLTQVKAKSTGRTYNAQLNSLNKVLKSYDERIESAIKEEDKQKLIRERGLYQGAYDQLISGQTPTIPRTIPLLKP